MNLLDKYVVEVGKHLPHKNRADIEAEIRSTLQDMLDERSASTGKPADDTMVKELLKEYGAPEKVAASYRPTEYLIGPRLFPAFKTVIKIVISVWLAVSVISFGISFANNTNGPDFINGLRELPFYFFSGLISAFGNVVLVFAILERVLPAFKFGAGEEKEWDPAELAKKPDSDVVKPVEQIFTIIFTVIGLLIFNLYPDVIGLVFFVDGKWTTVPALSDAFFNYLPWINLLGVLQIGLSLIMLRDGYWKTFSLISNIAIKIGNIILVGFMLRGPSLVNLSVEELASTPLAKASGELIRLFDFLPTLVLAIIIISSAIEVGKTTYRMFNRRTTLYPTL